MRIAWFTPFGSRSAIGQFSAQVVSSLAANADIDIWTDEAVPVDSGVPVVNYSNAAVDSSKLNRYDIVVYNFGNYLPYHKAIYETSKRHRGIVILHDRVMHHFFAGYCFDIQQDPNAYLAMMEQHYGSEGYRRARISLGGGAPRIWEDDTKVVRYPLFEECAVNAEGVIVHAEGHAQAVRNRYCGPVRALYLPAYSATRGFGSERHSEAKVGDRLTLLTIGHGNRNKRIHDVIRVFGEDEALARQCRYIVIGPIESCYRVELEELIDKYSLHSTVSLMGFQTDEVLSKHLAMSDIAINLRLPSMEGSSASLMLEMAYGKPVVCYDAGFFGELPAATVVRVDPSVPNALHAAIDCLVSSPELRAQIGSEARAFAVRWDEKSYAQEFLSFVEEVKLWRPALTQADTVAGQIRWMGFSEEKGLCAHMAEEISGLFLPIE